MLSSSKESWVYGLEAVIGLLPTKEAVSRVRKCGKSLRRLNRRKFELKQKDIHQRGAYDKFPDFFRMGWLTNFHDFRFKWTATAGIGIHPTKTWLSQLMNFKNAIWHFKRTIGNKIVLNLEKIPQKRMECFGLLFDHLAWIEHQFLSGIRDSRKAGSLWGMMRAVGGVRKSTHQSWLAKGLESGLLCWGL